MGSGSCLQSCTSVESVRWLGINRTYEMALCLISTI